MRDPYTYLFTHPFVNIHRSPFDITKSTNSSIIDDSPKWSVTLKIIFQSVQNIFGPVDFQSGFFVDAKPKILPK